jgi:inosine-uridine nucleoside N-ribohydrolase
MAALASGEIILDTDSGIFGDDGVALTMLMRSARRGEVRGITVVSGNVWASAGAGYMRRTARLLDAAQLPVHIGSQAPLIHTATMAKLGESPRFAGAFEQKLPPGEGSATGIQWLIDSIERAPGRITILAIGPLTNLAIALRLRPDLEAKIGSLVMMGGAVDVHGNATETAEFNFWFDPEAAQIVVRSAIPRKTLFALDVCDQVKLTKEIFDEIVRVKTPITDLYREDFGKRYPGFLNNSNAVGSLWDELAASFVIEPAVVMRSEQRYLDVETGFGPHYGAVKPLDRRFAPHASPVTVVREMNFGRVFEIYKSALMAR